MLCKPMILLTVLGAFGVGAGREIIGGTEATPGEVPWQVGLRFLSGGFPFCGGAIISNWWLVTAASCSNHLPGAVEVVAGTTDFINPGTIHRVEMIIQHETFNSTTMDDNIAVWKVYDPILYNSNASYINLLPQGTPSPQGTQTTVSGWGGWESPNFTSKLTTFGNPIFDLTKCKTLYNSVSSFGVRPRQICGGIEGFGYPSCQEDAGGPLYMHGNLYGIVSWGNSCAYNGYPGVYTEVAAYRNWINQKTTV